MKEKLINWVGYIYAIIVTGSYTIGVLVRDYFLFTKVFWLVFFLLFLKFLWNIYDKTKLLKIMKNYMK